MRALASLAIKPALTVVATCVALVACAQAHAAELSPSERAKRAAPQEVIDTFVEVTAARAQGAKQRVSKWPGEMRVNILGATKAHLGAVAALKDALAEISQLTPLTVRYTDENPNFVVIFASASRVEFDENRQALAPLFEPKQVGSLDAVIQVLRTGRTTCSSFVGNKAQGLGFFALALTTDAKPSPGICVMQNVMMAIGLGLRPTRQNSVLDPTRGLTQFTDIDRAMIEAFYRPEIRPGMDINEAADTFERILKN